MPGIRITRLLSTFATRHVRRAATALLGAFVLHASAAGAASGCAATGAATRVSAEDAQHAGHGMPGAPSRDAGDGSAPSDPPHCPMPVSCGLTALAVPGASPLAVPDVAAELPARLYDLPPSTAAAPEPPPPKG